MADEIPSTPAADRYRLLSAIDNSEAKEETRREQNSRLDELLRLYVAPLFNLLNIGDVLNEIADDSKTQTVDRAVKSTKRIIIINKE